MVALEMVAGPGVTVTIKNVTTIEAREIRSINDYSINAATRTIYDSGHNGLILEGHLIQCHKQFRTERFLAGWLVAAADF